jgi:hypothetical protein
MDGKIERVNQVLEDMLRMHVMDNPSRWEDYLHLEKFTYNNGQQETLNMIPFEVIDGRKCWTPTNCDSLVNRIMLGPKMLQEME